jgi:uncharacterized membrane-anchored protein YitT (DUF2179 family)
MMQPLKIILYSLMVGVGLVAMYSILNAGNPDSILRPYIPDPRYDVYVAMVSSLIVFVLGFIVVYTRDREGFKQIIELNEQRIRTMRKQRKSDEEIAVSILAAMGSYSGYKHKMAKRKLMAYLTEFK